MIKKQKFLLNLGHKTWVDKEEAVEYAKTIFTGESWDIREVYFLPHQVRADVLYCTQINAYQVDALEKQRKGK